MAAHHDAGVEGSRRKMADSLPDLEYHVKFPPLIPRDIHDDIDKGSFKGFSDAHKLPVVILLGWAGCKDKYLAKYSAVYEEHGFITLRCTAPVVLIFLRHHKLSKLGKNLLDLLHELSLDEHPIFFHVFSNGGAFFYQHISQQMQRLQRKLNVKGVIFDSAPGKRRFHSVFRALTAILGGSSWYKIPVSFFITVFLFLSFTVFAFLKGLLLLQTPQTDPIMLVDEPYTWPQLFIYSKSDKLVKYQDVEKFALSRENKGVQVRTLCFTESPHVQHLLTSRKIYVSTLLDFTLECLK